MQSKRVVSMAVTAALALAGCGATESTTEVTTTGSTAEVMTTEAPVAV